MCTCEVLSAAYGGQKKTLQLEVVSLLMWVLETELRSSIKQQMFSTAVSSLWSLNVGLWWTLMDDS